MQELKLTTPIKIEDHPGKLVVLYFSGELLTLSGNWQWPLHTNAVYCSKEMSFPSWFEGTKAIIHPDDYEILTALVTSIKENILSIVQFRIITTYGEIYTLSGDYIVKLDISNHFEAPHNELLWESMKNKFMQREIERLNLKDLAFEHSEKMLKMGTWYMNVQTKETYYSDYVYHIYGLQPQSLNNHLHTFSPFTHPDDRNIMEKAFDDAFHQMVPLHLEFMIITADGIVKSIYFTTNWSTNLKGEPIIHGMIRDVSEKNKILELLAQTESKVLFERKVLHQYENFLHVGSWYLNVYTKKINFSDNIYRLLGLKLNALLLNLKDFLNYVHPDDQVNLNEIIENAQNENIEREIEFRIIRNDGKTRFIRQKIKTISIDGEINIIGVLHDITSQSIKERKLKEVYDQVSLMRLATQKAEEMASVGSWLWEINTGKNTWSEGMYHIIGHKPNSIEQSQAKLLTFIHPEDRKNFNDHLNLVLHENVEKEIEFRILSSGKIKYIRATFKLLQNDDKVFFLGTFLDHTREYILQQEFFERAQQSDTLIENLEDRIFISDLNNNIILFNRVSEKTFGYKKEEVDNKNFFEIFPFLKTTLIIDSFKKVLNGQKLYYPHFAFPALRKYFDMHLIPLRNSQNENTGILHVLHDVTYEYKMQQKLAERLGFIESFVDAAVDPVIALDRNMNYITWNKKAEEFYHIKRENIIGKNVLEIFPDTNNPPSYEDLRKALRGEKIYIPKSSQMNMGELSEVYLIPVKDERNEVSAILWMTRDKTNEVKLSEEGNRSKEMLDDLNENYFELDKEYNIIFINRAAERFFGRSREEMLGKNVQIIFPEVKNSPLFNAIFQVKEKGNAIKDEFFLSHIGITVLANISRSQEGVAVFFIDIQNIKENEIKLGKSVEQWRALVENSPDAITRWDKEGRLLFANNAFISRTGLSVSNIWYHTLIEMGFSGEVGNSWINEIKNIFTSRRESEHFANISNKDGKKLSFYSRMVPEFNPEGSVLSVLCITRDITEIREAQSSLNTINEELSIKTKVYEYAENIALIGTWTLKPDINDAFFSDNLFALFGLDPKVARSGFETILPYIESEDRDKILNTALGLVEEKNTACEEFRVSRSDGKKRIFKIRSKLILTDNGQSMIIGTMQDITEEAELQKKLAERTKYAETIIDSSIDRIIVLDLSYDILAWNKRSEEITGYKKANVIGKNIFDVFPKLAEDSILTNAISKSSSGEIVHIPLKQGIYTNRQYERFYIPLINEHKKVYAILVIMHDITDSVRKTRELKQLNESLETKNAELEEKNEEITNFAFVASHDLKEPLRKMHTFWDWLIEKEMKHISFEGKNYLNKLGASIKRLEVLIEDILVLTKIHADINKSDVFSLSKILERTSNELEEMINSSGAELIAEPMPAMNGNANQIFQLFKNLISNSIKFQVPGNKPVITISAHQVLATLADGVKKEGEYLKLSFKDNGVGMDPKYAKKIFQMFQRLHGNKEFGGTGMGLAICKKIMDNHEGAITVKTEPGKGAEFNCYFPLF